MLKRLLGSADRSRRDHAIDGEILLRVLTVNLMIIWRLYLKRSFQQSNQKREIALASRQVPAKNAKTAPPFALPTLISHISSLRSSWRY
ncbi:MAG TPA: hypothetical protein VNA25_01740 [Phycisphaerae bacterium]|nr:hypothetical protein [Phycisphaerae bacterium]